jgi:hypothetical protein
MLTFCAITVAFSNAINQLVQAAMIPLIHHPHGSSAPQEYRNRGRNKPKIKLDPPASKQ